MWANLQGVNVSRLDLPDLIQGCIVACCYMVEAGGNIAEEDPPPSFHTCILFNARLEYEVDKLRGSAASCTRILLGGPGGMETCDRRGVAVPVAK